MTDRIPALGYVIGVSLVICFLWLTAPLRWSGLLPQEPAWMQRADITINSY